MPDWLGTVVFDETNKFYNVADTNRENNNIQYLSDEINERLGSFTLPYPVETALTVVDFPYVSRIQRMRYNIKAMMDLFAEEGPTLTINPASIQAFNTVYANELERCLEFIYNSLERYSSYVLYIGQFYIGSNREAQMSESGDVS